MTNSDKRDGRRYGGGTYAEYAKPMIRKGEEVYAYKGDKNDNIWTL